MALVVSDRIEHEERIATRLNILPVNVALVGSQFIVGHGNDRDFLVLCGDEARLIMAGFKPDLEENDYPSNFSSWRDGDDNLVVVEDRGYFLAEYAIAYAAKSLLLHARNDGKDAFDMTERDGRVAFHSIIREAVEMRLHAYEVTKKDGK